MTGSGEADKPGLLEIAADFSLLEKLGKVFAASTIVPKDYRNNLANCVIALDMAFRMKAAP